MSTPQEDYERRKRRYRYLQLKKKKAMASLSEEVATSIDLPAESGKVPYGEASLKETRENLPGSIKNLYEDYKHLVTHPGQTIDAMGAGVFGGIENIAESLGWERPANLNDVGRASKEGKYQEIADAMGGYYKDRFGSWDAIKETAKTDPAGAFMDALGVTSLGAAGIRAVPGLAKTGAGVQRVAAAMDPVNVAISAAKAPGKMVPKTFRKSVRDATVEKVANLLPRHEHRAGRVLDEMGGPDALELQKNMAASSEIVPGNKPTAIQAAMRGRVSPDGMGPPTQPITRPEFAALDKPMKRRMPAESTIVKDEQRAVRLNSIKEGIAKTPAEREAAVKYRNKVAGPMYNIAKNDPNPVNLQPTLQYIEKVLDDNPKRPLVQKTFGDLKSLLTNKDGAPITSSKEAVSAIEGFKDLVSNKDNATIKWMLQNTKFKLMDDVPLYKAADAKYRELSRPINQMDIGTYIHKKLSNEKRVGDIEGQAQFSTAVDEAKRTIKNSLDEPRYDSLEEVLDGPQLSIINNAQREMNMDAVIAAQVKAGQHKMAEGVGTALDPPEIPGFLQREVTIIRNVMARMKGSATKKTMNYLADRQLSGPELARVWKAATPEEKAILGSKDAFATATNRALINQALFQSGRAGQENQ